MTIWHPFTDHTKETKRPLIVSGEGAYLVDESGKRYFDGTSSWWVNLHGHCHPKIVSTLVDQLKLLEQVIFADFTHRPALDLAKKLLPLLPGKMEKLFFSDNGSTAVEVAVKMALQFNKGKKILTFEGAYHGDTFGAMSVAGLNRFNKPFKKQLFDVVAIPPPFFGREELSIKKLKEALKKERFSAFIFEPQIQGAAGMKIHSKEALSELTRLCKEEGVLLIADEVMTGFGRTGELFASEEADLLCLSKGLTGGFLPLGVTATTSALFGLLKSSFLHGHSYTANPLACSAAIASLDLLLKPDCTSRRETIGKMVANFASELKNHPHFVRVESLGTILALELKSRDFIEKIQKRLLDKGLHLRPIRSTFYLIPPYCTSERELDHIFTLLKEELCGIC